jgi:cathepsin X
MFYPKLFAMTISLLLLLLDFPRIMGERKVMEKHTKRQHITSDLPYESIIQRSVELPDSFNWQRHKGENFLTRSLNQHLPHYCGSCWAHAAVSVLADRIKIIRMNYLSHPDDEFNEDPSYPDVSLSIQFILNCGGEIAGSCQGGSATGAFQFIKEVGYIPFDTCQPYMACSSDSKEELCKHVDTQCTPINICKTCTRDPSNGKGVCNQISKFPLARVDEYGMYKLKDEQDMDKHIFAIKSEIYMRGPVTAGIAGHHLRNYTGGIIYDDETLRDLHPTHEVSIVGWGVDNEKGVEYWIARNSWGEYWGEMSFFRLELGRNMLGIEKEISWATIKDFSIENEPCFEDGRNCNLSAMSFLPGIGQMLDA